MNYNKILKLIVRNKSAKWWRNYPVEFASHVKEISLEVIKFYLSKVFNEENDSRVGLYIHIPFCASRCYFCKYYSEPIRDKEIALEYINCLEKELILYEIDFAKHPLQSVYIGGGTPTLLDGKNWIKIFKIINKFFKIDRNSQIASEGTPETCARHKLELLKDLGVNRFSIGAQTFDEKILNSLNRNHSISDIYKAFENARRAGIRYLNMDLLFGLPGETKKSFSKTLRHAAEIRPECISPAFLDLNKNVLFSEEDVKNAYITKGKTEARALFSMAEFLKPYGYSNIIKGVYYQSLFLNRQTQAYNQNIVPKGSPDSNFAIGCHADSYLNFREGKPRQLQYHKEGRLQRYISQLKRGKMPVFAGTELLEDEIIRQYLIYCFIFLQGRINKRDFLSRFGQEPFPILKTKFARLLKDHEFKEDGGAIYFQKPPYYFANREELLLFCLKYLYSPEALKGLTEKTKNESLNP